MRANMDLLVLSNAHDKLRPCISGTLMRLKNLSKIIVVWFGMRQIFGKLVKEFFQKPRKMACLIGCVLLKLQKETEMFSIVLRVFKKWKHYAYYTIYLSYASVLNETISDPVGSSCFCLYAL